jgi:5'-nucleotidase
MCNSDADCLPTDNGCDLANVDPSGMHHCRLTQCAEQIYIGHTQTQITCSSDNDCPGPDGKPVRGGCESSQTHKCYRVCLADNDCPDDNGHALPGGCDKNTNTCLSVVQPTNLYELATSNYLAGGGSGFRTLQRNTTQFDTKIQQRDALVDYIRQGKPCGYKTDAQGNPLFSTKEGLKVCAGDGDCASEGAGLFVCACVGGVDENQAGGASACVTKQNNPCDPAVGRCVRKDCRDSVAQFHERRCAGSPNVPGCRQDLSACGTAGEECKFLACIDEHLGATTDSRVEMLGK